MKVIIDRFEEEEVVVELEHGGFIQVSKRIFPSEVKEGDIVSINIEKEETKERAKYMMQEIMKDMWED